MRSQYEVDAGLSEGAAIAEIQRVLNLPPPEPEQDYTEYVRGLMEGLDDE